MSEDSEQALTDEQNENPTPAEHIPIPEIERRTETWPHDDTRKVVRAADYLHSRNVGFVLICGGCQQALTLEGHDNGGASLMGCGCCVRRWV